MDKRHALLSAPFYGSDGVTGSRMINTLVALLGALTLGTLALIFLETDPIRPQVISLMAGGRSPKTEEPHALVRHTDVPVQPMQWQNIVVHATGAEGAAAAARCHFLLEGDGSAPPHVRVTDLWRRQQPARHVPGASRTFDDASVAICLTGDFSTRPPTDGQFRRLIDLVRSLQEVCRIRRSQVYLHRDLDTRSHSPGKAFPSARFNAALLPAGR